MHKKFLYIPPIPFGTTIESSTWIFYQSIGSMVERERYKDTESEQYFCWELNEVTEKERAREKERKKEK
jgi:hypothetical protein